MGKSTISMAINPICTGYISSEFDQSHVMTEKPTRCPVGILEITALATSAGFRYSLTLTIHVKQRIKVTMLRSKYCKTYTSSTAQGGGGSFKNRKPIGELGCCESGMAEWSHWWIESCLISLDLTLSLSFSGHLLSYLSIFYVSIYRSIYLSIDLSLSLFHLITYLPIYLSIYLSTYVPIYLSIYLSLSLSSVYLSSCLPVCLSICLSVYLSTCGAVSFSVM